jgi:hypothetical protein
MFLLARMPQHINVGPKAYREHWKWLSYVESS